MSANKGFATWNWKPLVRGTTKRAVQVTSTDADVVLARVVATIEEIESDAAKIVLDSLASGVTLTSGAIGAWDFTIGPIAASVTGALNPVFHTINITMTDAAGNVLEPIKGSWQILPQ